MLSSIWPLVAVAVSGILLGTASAAAQSQRPYVTVAVFDDVKRFSGNADSKPLDGEPVGISLSLGQKVASHWDVEASVDIPRFSETSAERNIMLRSAAFTVDSVTRNRALSVSALVRFTPIEGEDRVRLGYLAGLSFVQFHQEFETVGRAGVPSSLIPRPYESHAYATAPTVGVDLRVPIGTHLQVVPALYAAVFRAPEISALLVRPRVGIRWTF